MQVGPEDADAVAALVRAAFAEQSVRTDPPASALRLTGAAVRAHLAVGGGGACSRVGGDLAGSILWGNRGNALCLSRLAVAPRYRRRGIANALLSQAEMMAREAGCARLLLETRLVLLDNRRLFAALGFREVSEHAHPGYAQPTFVLMEKPLSDCQDGMGSASDRA